MKNRESLLKTSVYDTLVRMNKNLNPNLYYNGGVCIMDALIGDEKKVADRCLGLNRCDECIQSYLNEE